MEMFKKKGIDYIDHNICLAENIFYNLCCEDFKRLDRFNVNKLYETYRYLKLSKTIENDRLNSLLNGELLTVKKRTLLEAIYESKNAKMATVYIKAGNLDFNLIKIVILYGNIDETLIPIFKLINCENMWQDQIEKFRDELNEEAKVLYLELESAKDKKELVKRIEMFNMCLDGGIKENSKELTKVKKNML